MSIASLLRRTTIGLAAVVAALATFALGSCATTPPVEPSTRYLTSAGAGANASVADGVSSRLNALLSDAAALLPSANAAIVVGVVDAGGNQVRAAVGNAAIDDRSLFEFGSITKVMTSTLLAELVLGGRVDLQASVYEYLPVSARADQWKNVSVEALATHSAGVPEWPANRRLLGVVLSGRTDNPFAGYSTADLREGIKRTRVTGSGSPWKYSNFGFAVLGYLVSTVSREPYADLVAARIFAQLGMDTAGIDTWESGAVAPPLNNRGRPTSNFELDAFAPAGAARGNLDDALRFLAASIRACDGDDELSRALCYAQQPRGVMVGESSEMGLGWVRTTHHGHTVIWHNGGTGGYSTFLGFNRQSDEGIVILANVGFLREIDGLAMRFLTGDSTTL